MKHRFPVMLALAAVAWSSVATSQTIDELVSRVDLPYAQLSPDARHIAVAQVRGDPLADDYGIEVVVQSTRDDVSPRILAQYRQPPARTYTEAHWFKPTAASFMWLDDERLALVGQASGKSQLYIYSLRDGSSVPVLDSHDGLWIASVTRNSSQLCLSIVAKDGADTLTTQPRDRSVRITDSSQFFHQLRNPSSEPRIRTVQITYCLGSPPIVEDVQEGPEEGPNISADDTSRSAGHPDLFQDVFMGSRPSRYRSVIESNARSGTRQIIVSEGNVVITRGQLMPPTAIGASIIGWDRDDQKLFYIKVTAETSELISLDILGEERIILRLPALLTTVCDYGLRCAWQSRDGRHALLKEQTNLHPDRLILVDLERGSTREVLRPNSKFDHQGSTKPQFVRVRAPGSETWGRLYLPTEYVPGRRYPLVITLYTSTPGFIASVGDEVPIRPLQDAGIAIFALNAANFNRISSSGEFNFELDRLSRPLEAIRWIIDELSRQGVVDPKRVGLTGLSYASEIAMYSYWASNLFAAVSVSGGSWDPVAPALGGIHFSTYLHRRGFPTGLSADDLEKWKSISAGLNIERRLPPLLIQSPDREEMFTVPTWYRLRSAGKPVDWLEYPEEGHLKISPANRWWVYKRNLDWFRFWLQDFEDRVPKGADQYERWRAMRGSQ